MEHLFKLKKDGKTVGYMKFAGAKPLYQKHPFPEWHTNNNFTPLLCNSMITELSIHPFVTLDKNGKNVFAGDTIKAGSWYFEVIWQKYGFGLKGKKSGWWRQIREFEHIELAFEGVEKIEDKEDA